jgi:uncharacterized protein YgbK (DUF1537 family)
MSSRATSPWHERLRADRRRVVVFDDDPTGAQCAADVDILLRPDLAAFERFFATGDRAVYVLTNSRALDQPDAVELLARVRAEALQAAGAAGAPAAFVLRGDSTLRGHVFAEMEVFGLTDAVGLLVPAFPDGGRVTLHGVHYLVERGRRVPVAETEFARDPAFGYRSATLVEWVREVGGDRPVTLVDLDHLHAEGPAAVTAALLATPLGGVVVPDALTDADVELVAWGLLDAEARGRTVVVRAAASFAAARSGLTGRRLGQVLPAGSRVLVVCGSHTEASTRQLAALTRHTPPVVTLPTDAVLGGGAARVVEEATARAAADLDRHGVAVVATERSRRAEHGQLTTGAEVMDALVRVAAAVAPSCDAVVAKGGITSAEVAAQALGGDTARVRGQLAPGVPMWDVRRPDGSAMPYVVVPGNVGDDTTLLQVAERVGLATAGPARQPE